MADNVVIAATDGSEQSLRAVEWGGPRGRAAGAVTHALLNHAHSPVATVSE